MKEFGSFGALAEHLITRDIVILAELQAGLEIVATAVEKTAKSEFGTYQPETGPFPAWEDLAEATKDDRVRQGYSEDEPLLRTGELRDSIEHQVEPLEAVIGSDDDRMIYHEFGTTKMPARPVLGPAAHRSKDVIEKVIGIAFVSGLVGDAAIHPLLGYDFETEKP